MYCGRWAVFGGKTFIPQALMLTVTSQAALQASDCAQGCSASPSVEGHKRGTQGQLLAGNSDISNHYLFRNKLCLLGDVLNLDPVAGMTSCPQGRCKGSRLHGSSISSQSMQVSDCER